MDFFISLMTHLTLSSLVLVSRVEDAGFRCCMHGRVVDKKFAEWAGDESLTKVLAIPQVRLIIYMDF